MASLQTKIEELKEHVSVGDYEKIDQWFLDNKNNSLTNRENKTITEKDFLKHVVLYIGQYVGFFNFKKNTENSDSIHQEALKREKAILKHFEFKEQIHLISSLGVLGQFKEEYLSLLKAPDSYNIFSATRLLTQLFHEENFELLEKLENYFKPGFFNQKYRLGEIQLIHNAAPHIFDMEFNEPLFAPYYDIIFNYTQNKEDYLLSRNIVLPTNEEAHTLINSTLHEDDSQADDFFITFYQDCLSEGVKSYCQMNIERESHQNSIHSDNKNKSLKI